MSHEKTEEKVFNDDSRIVYETEEMTTDQKDILEKYSEYGEVKEVESLIVRKKGVKFILRFLVHFKSKDSIIKAINDNRKLYIERKEKSITLQRKEVDNLEHTFALFIKFGKIEEIFHKQIHFDDITVIFEDVESLEEANTFAEKLKTMFYGAKSNKKDVKDKKEKRKATKERKSKSTYNSNCGHSITLVSLNYILGSTIHPINCVEINKELERTNSDSFSPISSKWIEFPTFSENLVTLQKSQNIYYKNIFQSSTKPTIIFIISFNPIQLQPSDLIDPNDYSGTQQTKIKINLQFRSLDIIKRVEYAETDFLSFLSSLGGFFGILKISMLLASLFEYSYETIREQKSQIDDVIKGISGEYIQVTKEKKVVQTPQIIEIELKEKEKRISQEEIENIQDIEGYSSNSPKRSPKRRN
eukprot:gene2945-4955_t